MVEIKKEEIKEYLEDLIQNIIAIEKDLGKNLTKNKISDLKNKIARKYKISKPPRDMDLMLFASKEQLEVLKHLKCKPSRSLSGVAVVAVMTKPHKCPHGKCVFCPGGISSEYGDTPQSYTGFEPSARRAIRNKYDSFLIVINRLVQYIIGGHSPNKVDCIIMGGNFPSYDFSYQLEVVTKVFGAMNAFSDLFYKNGELDLVMFKDFFELPHDPDDPDISPRVQKRMKDLEIEYFKGRTIFSEEDLEMEKNKNETAAIRCIGLTQETRPDYCTIDYANRMLDLGTTRVEIGVQSIFDDVLRKSNRGHNCESTIIATKTLKDLGFKINYHMMLGMPQSNEEKDIISFKEIFSNPKFKPDMLKIYPLLVIPGTITHEEYLNGNYVPYSFETTVKLLAEIMSLVPEYCRVMRIQRDIPSNLISGGIKNTNLKQFVEKYMAENNIVSREIRTRESCRINLKSKTRKDPIYEIKIKEYDASDGKEFFMSYEDVVNDEIIGYCRMRFISEVLRKEFTSKSAIIRELHVNGSALNFGQKEGNYADDSLQHKGVGKNLLLKAEELAIKNNKEKMLVISGVGVKEYYKKFGYSYDGPYMSKTL